MSPVSHCGLFRQLPVAFGGYELLELFPGGGMSFVYRAKTRIGKTVVVKILKPEQSDPETHQRFTDEARTAASLNHPNIVSVYDFGESDGLVFMVMEYLEGQDLSELIAERRIADLREKLRIAADAASALRHVHEHEILHRDIKPANIFVCSTGAVKLIDFGIAKSSANSAKTRAGFTIGTLYYMAPEQVHGTSDRRTDIYAFGLVLYQLLTGRQPVTGENVQEIFFKILNEPLDLSPLAVAQLPDELVDLVRRCTQKNPALRPADFDEVHRVLSNVLARFAPFASVMMPPPSAMVAPPPAAAPRARSKTPLIAGIAAAVVAIAAGTWWFSRSARVPETAAVQSTVAASALPSTRSHPTGDMVLVPAGEARFGSANEAVTVPAFYIDRTEVTNRAWSDYRRAQGWDPVQGDPALPATNVTYDQAQSFCEFAGKRLPTAQEWEKAARGPDGLPYPWGQDRIAANANVDSAGVRPVGSFAAGASAFGGLDMAGNVWEFAAGDRKPTPEDIAVFRQLGITPPPTESEPWVLLYGGSYAGHLAPLWDAAVAPARYADKTIGFRCAATP